MEPSSRFLFLGRQVLHSASKWACMGGSMDRKLHWRKPLSVVAAISLTWKVRVKEAETVEVQRRTATSPGGQVNNKVVSPRGSVIHIVS